MPDSPRETLPRASAHIVPPASGRAVLLGLAALTLLALALRLVNIGAQSLWEDEAASVDYARHPVWELATRSLDPGNPPLYYLMLKGWMALWGTSDLALRSLSVLCGVLCIPALFALARRLSGRPAVALGAAFLLAIAPRHVFFSQEIRAYVPIALLAIVSTHVLLAALRTGGWWRWSLYVLLAACAPYLHFQGFLLLLAQGVAGGAYLLAARAPRRAWAAWAVAQAALAGLALPAFFLFFVPGFLTPHGYNYWQGKVTLSGVAEALTLFTISEYWIAAPHWLGWDTTIFAAVVVIVGTLGPLALLWRGRGQYHRAALLVVALTAYVGPVVFILACLTRTVWQAKYLIVFQPLYLAVLAAGLFARPPRTPRRGRVLLASILVLALPGLLGDLLWRWRPDYRGVARILNERNPDRHLPVQAFRFAHRAVRYYYDGPVYTETDPGDDPPNSKDAQKLLRRALLQARRHGGVFVVLSSSQASSSGELDEIEHELGRLLTPGPRYDLHNVRLLEFGAPVGPPTTSAATTAAARQPPANQNPA